MKIINLIWYLSWDTKEFAPSGNQIIRNVEIDGNTGKVLLIYNSFFGDASPGHPLPENVILEDNRKNSSSSNTYKTYEGKNYTEEEWLAFEEQQWASYQKNKNNKRNFLAD